MAKLLITKGATSRLTTVFIQDATSSTGAGLSGLVYNSAGLTAYYYRDTAAGSTAITLATMTVGTWASGGFKEIDATNMPGWYQLGIPNAALASGATYVDIHLQGAANMIPVPLEIQLITPDTESASFGISGGDVGDSTGVTTLLSRLSSARAGFLDNLNVGGNVASSTEVQSIQNNTDCVRAVPNFIDIPTSGTVTYRIELALYDDAGNMETPDSAPTVALVNQAGTDRASRLDSTTMALVSTGRYRVIYTASDTDTPEQLVWAFSVVEGGQTRVFLNTTLIVSSTSVDFTSADRTKLEAVFNKLPSKAYLTGTTNTDGDIQMDEATGNFPGSVNAVVTRVTANTDQIEGVDATNQIRDSVLSDTTRIAGADVSAIKAKTDNLPTTPAAAGDAMTLTSGERIALSNALLDLANAVESGLTLRQAVVLMSSVLLGLTAGFSEGGPVTFSSADIATGSVVGTKTRITATTSAGNRTAITVDFTP